MRGNSGGRPKPEELRPCARLTAESFQTPHPRAMCLSMVDSWIAQEEAHAAILHAQVQPARMGMASKAGVLARLIEELKERLVRSPDELSGGRWCDSGWRGDGRSSRGQRRGGHVQ